VGYEEFPATIEINPNKEKATEQAMDYIDAQGELVAGNACDWDLSIHVNVLQLNHHFSGGSGLYILSLADNCLLLFLLLIQSSHSYPLSILFTLSAPNLSHCVIPLFHTPI
jgi:hypothetical protein